MQHQAPEPGPVAAQAPATTAPPDAEKLREVYHYDFRDGRYDNRWLHLEPNGPLGSLVKPDPRGLRIAIPAKTDALGVGAFTRFGVHGDFEVTASFEILKADRPEGRGQRRARALPTDGRRLGQLRLDGPD